MSAVRVSRPPRYGALSLLRHGLSGREWPRAWADEPMRGSYDVVIIGGGVHGLAAAYYLAVNHGITNVAVLDKGYIGGGGSGRSTAILRSNYLTPEGVRFYDRSMQLYRTLAADLDYNVMFSQRGHLTLAHSDAWPRVGGMSPGRMSPGATQVKGGSARSRTAGPSAGSWYR